MGDVTKDIRVKDGWVGAAIRSIFEGTAAATGDRFFRLLVQHLVEVLGVRYAFIATTDATQRAIAIEGDDQAAIDRWLAGAGRWIDAPQSCFDAQDIRQHFPNDAHLATLQIESYLGVPILSQGERVGTLAVMDCRAIADVAPILSVFAVRVGAELERLQQESALRQKEQLLQQVLDHLPQQVFWKDTRSVYLGGNRTWAAASGLSHSQTAVGKRDEDLPWQTGAANLFYAQDQHMLATGEPIDAIEDQMRTTGAKTWFAIRKTPIATETGRIIGVLGTVEDMSAQRQTEVQLRQQAARDRLLKDISLQIRQSLNLEDTLHTAVAAVQQVLQVDRVLVYRLTADPPATVQRGELVAAATASDWSIAPSHQIWHGESYTQFAGSIKPICYERGEICVVNDASHNLPPDQLELLARLEVKAKLVVPLMQGDALWGLLTVHHCAAPHRWENFEIDLLQQLATQVAIAIQQAQLFDQVQQQAQCEQLCNSISQSISSSLDSKHILQEIVRLTGESFGVDRVLIFGIEDGVRAVHEWRVDDRVLALIDCDLNGWDGLLIHADGHFYPFHAPDFDRSAGFDEQLSMQILSMLCAPIVLRDQLFGGLALQTTVRHRTFTAEEIQLLGRIADQTAIALYNAQSYAHLEQFAHARTRELEAEKLISEAANRAKSEFLAVMSHELRTPLNAILGLSDLLGQEIFGALNAKQQEYIDCIHTSGEHLLALISDILDLSKVEAGKEELALAPVVIADLCAYCLSLVQERAIEAGLELTSSIDPAAKSCVADERRLRQMILNLLSNAIKFTPKGEISLIVQQEPQGISFIVADTGIGIAPEHLPTLFQPFHQLDSQLDRRYEGTGLGLVLTQRLAQLHGGDVTVESVLAQGSRFTIYLPDLSAQTAAPYNLLAGQSLVPFDSPIDSRLDAHSGAGNSRGRLATSPVLPRQKRILIVEDDHTSAMLIQDYLQVVGYKVEHFADGVNFMQRLRRFQPDLILMDVQLSGGTTGLDLLITLRQEPDLQQLPVVMVTAMAMRGDRERMLAAGATDYLSKPLGLMQLESMLLRCL